MKIFKHDFSLKKTHFLLFSYYPTIFFQKLKNKFITLKYYIILNFLIMLYEFGIRAFLNEAQRLYPKIKLKKFKSISFEFDLSSDSPEAQNNQTGNVKKINPFKNYKVKTEHHYVESQKVRAVQSKIMKYVFAYFFLIDLNANESYTLSCYSDASMVCFLFLKFNKLSTRIYLEHEDYDKLRFFYKHFIEIVKIRVALKDYQFEVPKIPFKSSIHYIRLVYYFISKGINLGYLLSLKDILSSDFPTLDLRRFELEQLRYKLKEFKRDIQRKNSNVERNKEIISDDLYFQILTELGVQNENILKELERRDLDFNEDKYSELDSLFNKYRNLIRDIHSNQIDIFLIINIYLKTRWRKQWLTKITN